MYIFITDTYVISFDKENIIIIVGDQLIKYYNYYLLVTSNVNQLYLTGLS